MDKMSLMLEADKRGLLPPEQKAILDEAIKRGLVAQEKPAAVSFGETLREIPRQVGLTARHGLEGLGEVVGIGSEPIRAVTNPVLRAAGLPTAGSARETGTYVADLLGLPKPENANERVAGDVSRMMAGGGAIAGGARQVAKSAGPVVSKVGELMSQNVGQQVSAAAGAGGAGGAVREAGGGPVEQFVASLAGGLTAAGLTSLATKAYDALSSTVRNLVGQKSTVADVDVMLNRILEQSGVQASQLPGAVRRDLAEEVKRALDTGGKVNEAAIRRMADYGRVGATPTRGSVTLDPVQITQERNIAKIGANSQDPRLQQLARVQNENNARLIDNLNEMGAGAPGSGSLEAGTAATGAVQARDAAAKAVERSLYGKAKDSAGRGIELDREGFVFDAYNRLAESNKGAFLPEGIKTVLEQLRVGKTKLPDGREVPFTFTVDTIDNIKTMLSTAQRGAADGNVRAALSQVRSALDATQPKAVGRPVGGAQVVEPGALNAAQAQADDLSGASMDAFDKARRFAAARRNWQESAEGIRAALDEISPDRFVKDYIITNGNKGATAEVEKLMFTIRRDPQAQQAVKENIVSYFKERALGASADEVGNFSASNFNKALREFGDAKLKLFFSPEEIAQLKSIGRVASYETFQPRGSAVNNSNTASGIAGILDRIASNPLIGRLPFGDAAVRQPAQNWSLQIKAKTALDPKGALIAPAEAAQQNRVRDLLGPGLLLAAPRADSRENQKRR